MMRLPELGRESLSDSGRQIYDGIVASRGGVRGPFAALMHSPEVAGRAAHLGTYLRFETSLDPVTLQIVTLAVAREWDCQYEWTAHEPQARAALVREEAILAIKERQAPDGLTEDEAMVVRYTQELIRDHRVSAETFDKVKARFSSLEIREVSFSKAMFSIESTMLKAKRFLLLKTHLQVLWPKKITAIITTQKGPVSV